MYYADIIKEELTKRDKPYIFLDIGSYDGGFLKKVINALPEYNIETVATDINQKELVKNFAGKKVVASAEKLPLADESVDVVTMRYVLHLVWKRHPQPLSSKCATLSVATWKRN